MRTLKDHETRVTAVARFALGAFADRGVSEVQFPLRDGDTITIRRIKAPNIPPEYGPRLCLYWMIYFEVDRLLRQFDPIEERPAE